MVRLGMFETPISHLKPQRCKRCARGALYWQDTKEGWRLHHWSCPKPGDAARFVLHRCGFDSSGNPVSIDRVKEMVG